LVGFQKKLLLWNFLHDYVRESHIRKWTGEALAHALKIRNALVLGLQEFLVSKISSTLTWYHVAVTDRSVITLNMHQSFFQNTRMHHTFDDRFEMLAA